MLLTGRDLNVMERNRDFRGASISAVNGLPRRRQRITTLRDSTDQDREMDLQETVRLGDREQVHNKDREREFPKRRRVDRSTWQQRSDCGENYRENESTDSSGEEYTEEEEEKRLHQNKRTNNRRGLRTLRSSPVLRAAADEMFGFLIPRRTRSASAKRLHEYYNSGSGGFGDDLSRRRFFPSPAAVSLISSGGASPSSSGASMKKKMKSLDRKTPVSGGASNPNPSVVQDDIEIEVAEALFDLMKQSQSKPPSSRRQEKVEGDSVNAASDELQMLKGDGGKDENNAFSVQNEPSIKVNGEAILADSAKELEREARIEREKFPDDLAQDLVNGDGFVNKVKVGSPNIKVNACDIQDPTVTKAQNEAIIAEAEKEAKLEIDLMALPPVPPSPERDASVDIGTDPEVTTQVVQKKSEAMSKDGPLAVAAGMQEEKIGIINSSTQQQRGRNEQKNQSVNSLLPFPIGMNSWPGVLPHPGCISPALPMNGSAKSSMITQPPQFKFSQPRPRRCATHQFLAHNIHSHRELVKKSLLYGSTGPAALYGTKPSNLKYMLPPTQNFIPGNPLMGDFQGGKNPATASVESVKDRKCDAAINDKIVPQHASHPGSASNFLLQRGPSYIFPFGHYQTTTMALANSSVSPQSASANSAGRFSVNSSHPLVPSNEAYMAMLQNTGYPIPISTNIAMPSFKEGSPSMPFFNPFLYASPVFNATQNQHLLTTPQTTNSSSQKQPESQKQTNSHPVKPSNSQPMNFAMIPPVSIGGNKNIDTPLQGSKGGVDLFPQAIAFSFSSNASTSPELNFSSMAQNSATFQILPDMSWNGNNQMKNLQASEVKFLTNQSFNHSSSDSKEMSAPSTIGPPKFDRSALSINFLRSSAHNGVFPCNNTAYSQLSMANNNSFIPVLNGTQGQTHVTFGNNPISATSFSNPLISRNMGTSQRNASTVGTGVSPSQEVEASAGGTGQKSSSPACRRIVPSILSTCTGQLPELKY